jgi:hypothetical protein
MAMGHILAAGQDGVRQAQNRRSLLQQDGDGLRREGHGHALGDHAGGVQQVARYTRGDRRSSGERRRLRVQGMLIRCLRRPWIAEL